MNQIKITLIFVLSLLFIKVAANAEVLYPKTTSDFKRTSVRVYNPEKNSGGTGSIYMSNKNGSVILTNKHVCRLIEQGGYVEQNDKDYEITAYKKFADHDLCTIYVEHNFKINLKISKQLAKASDTIYVSGHPHLLPHIVTKGHLSDNMDIRLIVGVKDGCSTNPFLCALLGGDPVIQKFDSQVVSNLIQPGSSGSAVFNAGGEIIGVVFAGSGDLSFGFIVPQKYLLYFMAMEKYTPYVPVGTPVDDFGLRGRVFNYEKCEKIKKTKSKKYIKARNICRATKDNMIKIGK